jgi:hypothetical protein
LAHATGQLGRQQLRCAFETEAGEDVHWVEATFSGTAVDLKREPHIVENVAPRQKSGRLRHPTEVLGTTGIAWRLAEDADSAGVRLQEARKDP